MTVVYLFLDRQNEGQMDLPGLRQVCNSQSKPQGGQREKGLKVNKLNITLLTLVEKGAPQSFFKCFAISSGLLKVRTCKIYILNKFN